MPAPANTNDFLDLAIKAGLLDKPAIDAFRKRTEETGQFPETPKLLAEVLVREGLLTNFQADHLLAGKWRGFVIAGKYRLLQRVGAGGMGSVYLAQHILMKRRVALKVLPASQAEDNSALERFHREARAVAALDHPNIVRAHDIDHEDRLHFLVMEYVDGSSLQDIIKRFGPMDVYRAAHYVAQAACGLEHAHEAGIVHRDIKPGNLLVDRTGTVKVLDMGLARFFHDQRDELTKEYDATSVLGTADYLAPEQALDSHAVDIRADIYSLGATLYFLLAGRSPFQDGTVAQKLIWHQVREPKPIQQLRPEVPDELAAVISKMMAKNPADRYQSPVELIEALSPWMHQPVPPPPEEEMPRLGLAAQPDGGTRSTSMSQRIATYPMRLASTQTRDPGSSPSARSLAPRTPVPENPFALDSSRLRADDDRRAAAAFGPGYLTPDLAFERRNRIRMVVASACLVTLMGYGGMMIWAVAHNAQLPPPEPATALKPLPAGAPTLRVGFLRALQEQGKLINSVALSADGRLAVSGGADKSPRLWEVATGKNDRVFAGHSAEVFAVALSPDARWLLSGSQDKSVRLWDVNKGGDQTLSGHTGAVFGVAFAPDGRSAASASADKLVILWDIVGLKETSRLEGHGAAVRAVAFAPESKRLLSGGDDNVVCLWEVPSGKLLRKLEGHTATVRGGGVLAQRPRGGLRGHR